ncbi:DUF1488 domain-containing protein [Roseomonas xinghualingensis]|uniref:DUF1488 domain-containing protein n=1 Tax=Roseomonas xinghualingensis TaxID=2986475 RepID=UPI0021F13C05|nr:DUF1488 domain-containing protein [Roseomonas sp. SXEYE001]MCV4210100.1 DUF1488 domain-containing protein [Roseomonas sp. SXEYE001]
MAHDNQTFPFEASGQAPQGTHPAAANQPLSLRSPRWLHDRILFEIEERGTAIACSISKAAVQDACGRYSNLPRDVMSEFLRLRPRIEEVALAKLRERSGSVEGPVHVWSADLDDDPEPPGEASQAAIQP